MTETETSMLFRNGSKNGKLLAAGALLLALSIVLRQAIERSGHSTDGTDFVLGMMLGLGLGLLMLFLWRQRHKGPPNRLV